jgi:hypothetical protein
MLWADAYPVGAASPCASVPPSRKVCRIRLLSPAGAHADAPRSPRSSQDGPTYPPPPTALATTCRPWLEPHLTAHQDCSSRVSNTRRARACFLPIPARTRAATAPSPYQSSHNQPPVCFSSTARARRAALQARCAMRGAASAPASNAPAPPRSSPRRRQSPGPVLQPRRPRSGARHRATPGSAPSCTRTPPLAIRSALKPTRTTPCGAGAHPHALLPHTTAWYVLARPAPPLARSPAWGGGAPPPSSTEHYVARVAARVPCPALCNQQSALEQARPWRHRIGCRRRPLRASWAVGARGGPGAITSAPLALASHPALRLLHSTSVLQQQFTTGPRLRTPLASPPPPGIGAPPGHPAAVTRRSDPCVDGGRGACGAAGARVRGPAALPGTRLVRGARVRGRHRSGAAARPVAQ